MQLSKALALVLLLAVSGASAQSSALTCNLAANWTTTVPQIAFLGVNAACPSAAGAVSVSTCAQCVCASLGLFSSAIVNTTAQPNATDAGGFALLTDSINLCLEDNSSEFTDAATSEAGVSACLADSAFQADLNNNASTVASYCLARFAPSPPPGTSVGTSAPPPSVIDAIPPASEESSGEESSGEEVPPSPGVFPSPSAYPPVYPPAYPPGRFAPPPSPGSAATLSVANLAVQAAAAVLVLLATVLLF